MAASSARRSRVQGASGFSWSRDKTRLTEGSRKPASWRTETRLVELFGTSATDIKTERKICAFRCRSIDHGIDFFRTYYGPTLKAFAALDENGRQTLDAAMRELARAWNRSTRGALVIPVEYLEVVVVR